MATVKVSKQVSIQVPDVSSPKVKVKDGAKKTSVNFDLTPLREPRQLPGLVHVYLPHLHRQATEKSLSTPLSETLAAVLEAGLGERLEPDRRAATQAAEQVMTQLTPGLRKNKMGVEVKRPIVVESYLPWESVQRPDVTYLMPMELEKILVQLQEPGLATVELRAHEEEEISATYRSIIAPSTDRQVSPRLTYDLLRAVLTAVLSRKDASNLSAVKVVHEVTDTDVYLGLQLPQGWRVELVPAISARDENMYHVAKPYPRDASPGSQLLWHLCFGPAETDLLRSVSSTDKGQRARAVTLVTLMCQRHVNLRVLHAYQVQTAMLHDIDVHVDQTPRWQRSAPEQCVLSVLRRLLTFVRSRRLPHFFLQDLDLLQPLTSRQLTLARSALERLVSSDDAVVSLLRRLLLPEVTLEEKFEHGDYDSDSSSSTSSLLSESSTAIVLPECADEAAGSTKGKGEKQQDHPSKKSNASTRSRRQAGSDARQSVKSLAETSPQTGSQTGDQASLPSTNDDDSISNISEETTGTLPESSKKT